ncbi:hypothetical protein Nepgr_003996 [Nepenthes gracilis]|uniref:Uncharacterized protein n=1 Tax=Nepenthes gracilis TaxID=150966 RepID=A0AAD3XEK5_NEPGR|nr:hypothetical protein Nepgr_003996 [Nepenthes gracilis]
MTYVDSGALNGRSEDSDVPCVPRTLAAGFRLRSGFFIWSALPSYDLEFFLSDAELAGVQLVCSWSEAGGSAYFATLK